MIATPERQTGHWFDRKSFDYTPHHLLVEGGRMHFVDEGQGSPILFVHGNSTWSYMYRAAIRELATAGHRCVAPDHIGFGLSEKPKQFAYTPAALSRNLSRLVEHLDLWDITIVAHDFGGPIGLSFATDHPDRVRRIVLLNTWMGDISAEPGVAKMSNAAKGGIGQILGLGANLGPSGIGSQFVNKDRWTDQLRSAYTGAFPTKDDQAGARALARHMTESSVWLKDVWASREAVQGKPMSMIWGMKDSMFGEKMLNRIWHEFPLADVHSLKDSGRYAIEESPREVISHVKSFLEAPVGSGGFMA